MNAKQLMYEWYHKNPKCSHKEYLDKEEEINETIEREKKKAEEAISEWYDSKCNKFYDIKIENNVHFYGYLKRNIDKANRYGEFYLDEVYKVDTSYGKAYIIKTDEDMPINKFWLDCQYLKNASKITDIIYIKEISKEEFDTIVSKFYKIKEMLNN